MKPVLAGGALALVALGFYSAGCRTAATRQPGPARTQTVLAEEPRANGATSPIVATTTLNATRSPSLPAESTAPPADARRESCGSISRLLAPGSGQQRPSDDDRVSLDYTMFTRSGRALDSSQTHGETVSDSVRNLGPGLPCVVKRMRVGESRRVWVPASLQPPGDEGPRSVEALDLIVDVTLQTLTPAPQRPADWAAPPSTAQRTATGLRFRVLHRGSGEQRPVANSRVTIYHSGWTARGALFASSALAGVPASYLTYELPTGLSEGIQLMHVGDKLRFWLPERLAYATARRDAPKGPVVFDVELLAID